MKKSGINKFDGFMPIKLIESTIHIGSFGLTLK